MTNEDKDLSEGDLNVVVGVNDVGKAHKSRSVKDLGPGSSLHSIKKIHKHPKTSERASSKGTFNYDFVLLELAEPIKFSMEARPLFLADPGDKEAWTMTTPFISMLIIVLMKMSPLV